MRKYIIIAGSAVLVIGIVVGVILVLRQRTMVPEDAAGQQSSGQAGQTGGSGNQPQSSSRPAGQQQAGGAPAAPKAVCGNYACDPGETPQSCPDDCVLAENSYLGGHLRSYFTDAGIAEVDLDTNVPTVMSLEYGLTDKLELGKTDDGPDYMTSHRFQLKGIEIVKNEPPRPFYFQLQVTDRTGTSRTLKGVWSQ